MFPHHLFSEYSDLVLIFLSRRGNTPVPRHSAYSTLSSAGMVTTLIFSLGYILGEPYSVRDHP